MRVADEVARDHFFVRVRENALHRAVCGLFDLGTDLFVLGPLPERHRQVDDRHICGGHTEGHAGEHAVQARQHLAHGLGGARARRDDVEARAPSSTPILGGGAVDDLLRGRHRVHGSHEALGDGVVVMNDLGERREAVGRA